MVPSQSIRDRIVDTILTTLPTLIVAGADYWNTLLGAYSWKEPNLGMARPFVLAADVTEQVIGKRTQSLYLRDLTLVVTWVDSMPFSQGPPDVKSVANRGLADLQKAMESAAMLAALQAIDGYVAHEEVSSSTAPSALTEPDLAVETVWVVHYRTRRSDPAEGNP